MTRMLPIAAALALGVAPLQLVCANVEAARRKAQKAATTSTPDRPVIVGTVPNSNHRRVNKIDAVTSKAKVRDDMKTGAGKERAE